MVWAQRHSVSSSPGPSTELLGPGDDNPAAFMNPVNVKDLSHDRSLFTTWNIPCIYIRLWEANTFAYIPRRTQTNCTLINHSCFTIPVRWDWQSIEIAHVEPANLCRISNFWLCPCRWRWRIQTQSGFRSLLRLRILNVCYSPETCCSSPSNTGIMSDPWSSVFLSASGGHDRRSTIKSSNFSSRV